MSEKTADATIDFIARIVPPEEKVRITFHGGEPLLALLREYNIRVGTSVDGYHEVCNAQRGGYYEKKSGVTQTT